ncbi:hypothetical protein [Neisseria weaveri]|uniref:hypothetical protein n=1 Tax=Neisseria weaveri TaxID=28091 RepID=UPI000D30E827|nr:hypothetical protein [Neisseria weaveri]
MSYKFTDGSVFNSVHFALDKLKKQKEIGSSQVDIEEMIILLEHLSKLTRKETFWLTFGMQHEKSKQARESGLCKKSPYEKAGTIDAVNELLKEKKELLNQYGGKAALNRMILDLIAHGDIPAPSIPVKETVDSWIDNFKNTQIS